MGVNRSISWEDRLLIVLSLSALSVTGLVVYRTRTADSKPKVPLSRIEFLDRDRPFGRALRDTVVVFLDFADPISRQVLLALDSASSSLRLSSQLYVFQLPNRRVVHSDLIALLAACKTKTLSLTAFVEKVDSVSKGSLRSIDDWLADQLADSPIRACTESESTRKIVNRGWRIADQLGVTDTPAAIAKNRVYGGVALLDALIPQSTLGHPPPALH